MRRVRRGGVQIGRGVCEADQWGLEEVVQLELKETIDAQQFTQTSFDADHSSRAPSQCHFQSSPFHSDLISTDSTLSGVHADFLESGNDFIDAMQIDPAAAEGIIVALATKSGCSDSASNDVQEYFSEGDFSDLPEKDEFGSLPQSAHKSLIQYEEFDRVCELSYRECYLKCNDLSVPGFTGKDTSYEQLKSSVQVDGIDQHQHQHFAAKDPNIDSSLPAIPDEIYMESLQTQGSLSETDALTSDTIDVNEAVEDKEDHVQPSRRPGKKKVIAKNLASERRRRQKLNDRLYALRAIVPNISKMDKASIVADAIRYVCDLQKQVEEIETDISSLEGEAVSANRTQGAASPAPFSSENSSITSDTSDNDNSNALASSARKIIPESAGKNSVQLEVSKIEKQVYHLHFSFSKLEGDLLELLQGLCSLDIDILNASLICHQNHECQNSIIAKMQGWEDLSISEVETIIKDMILKFCRCSN